MRYHFLNLAGSLLLTAACSTTIQTKQESNVKNANNNNDCSFIKISGGVEKAHISKLKSVIECLNKSENKNPLIVSLKNELKHRYETAEGDDVFIQEPIDFENAYIKIFEISKNERTFNKKDDSEIDVYFPETFKLLNKQTLPKEFVKEKNEKLLDLKDNESKNKEESKDLDSFEHDICIKYVRYKYIKEVMDEDANNPTIITEYEDLHSDLKNLLATYRKKYKTQFKSRWCY